MREERSALVAYHYFDFKDASKRHVRGLLASLLSQLSDDSDACQDIPHELFKMCRDGSERPSDAALVKCLGTMLEHSGKPIFIITDALDECPSTTRTPSAREEVELRGVSCRVKPFKSVRLHHQSPWARHPGSSQPSHVCIASCFTSRGTWSKGGY